MVVPAMTVFMQPPYSRHASSSPQRSTACSSWSQEPADYIWLSAPKGSRGPSYDVESHRRVIHRRFPSHEAEVDAGPWHSCQRPELCDVPGAPESRRDQKESSMSSITRRVVFAGALAAASALTLAGCSLSASGTAPSASETSGSTVYFGVSAAITGQYAQYGEQFKEAFDLAVEEVNADGGIDGHPVALKYEDSQSDPKQSVTVAQKFVNDPDIALVFGDYSSAASIPASPIYTAGKLLQYGFNNSNPDFTAKGSEYQWSSAITTSATYTWTADYLKDQGIDTVGVTYLNTADWGIPAYERIQGRGRQDRPDDHRRRGSRPGLGRLSSVTDEGRLGQSRCRRPRRLRAGCGKARHAAARRRLRRHVLRRTGRGVVQRHAGCRGRDQRCAVPAVEPRREGPGVREGVHGEVPG